MPTNDVMENKGKLWKTTKLPKTGLDGLDKFFFKGKFNNYNRNYNNYNRKYNNYNRN